jgi:hypothetical protein
VWSLTWGSECMNFFVKIQHIVNSFDRIKSPINYKSSITIFQHGKLIGPVNGDFLKIYILIFGCFQSILKFLDKEFRSHGSRAGRLKTIAARMLLYSSFLPTSVHITMTRFHPLRLHGWKAHLCTVIFSSFFCSWSTVARVEFFTLAGKTDNSVALVRTNWRRFQLTCS